VPLASVYPLVSARAVARPFTYEVPAGTEPGAVVAVRFGRAKRRGIVAKVGVEPPRGVDIAAVEGVVDAIPPALVELALWRARSSSSRRARRSGARSSRRPPRCTRFPGRRNRPS
jgi:primosomal protein N'